MSRRIALSLVSAVALAAPLGLAGSAAAAPLGHVGGLTGDGLGHSASPISSPTPEPSPAWAGYYLDDGYSPATLTTTITVPRVKKCTSATRAIVAGVGADAFRSSSESFDLAGVFVGCLGGKARYFPVIVIRNTEKDYASVKISPGDTVVVSLTGGSSSSTASVVDKTHKSASEKRTGPGLEEFGSPAIFDWPWYLAGANEEGNLAGVPDFGTLHFSASKYAGQPFNSSTYSGQVVGYSRYKGFNKPVKLEIKTSPFASDNESFTTVFKHS